MDANCLRDGALFRRAIFADEDGSWVYFLFCPRGFASAEFQGAPANRFVVRAKMAARTQAPGFAERGHFPSKVTFNGNKTTRVQGIAAMVAANRLPSLRAP